MTETDSGSESLAGSKRPVVWKAHTNICACRIIGEAIITIVVTLSGNKEDDKYIMDYTHNWHFMTKTTNLLHHAGKREAKIWLEKTAVVLYNVLWIRGLVILGREVLVSEVGKLRRNDNCGVAECSHVNFMNQVNGGCSYTTASSRLNCTPGRSHDKTVSSGSENCSHLVKPQTLHKFQYNM